MLKSRLKGKFLNPNGVQTLASIRWELPVRSIGIRGPFAILHGGLKDQLDHQKQILDSLFRAGKAVQKVLKFSASEIALEGAFQLESNPTFNAGFGSKLQRDGVPRLSAALMDGETERMSSVSNIVTIKHPSRLVKKLQSAEDRNLCGLEATRFAYASGMTPEHLETKSRVLEWQHKISPTYGTIGCVALDSRRKTAACTSTGGKGFETPGRVSDSCTPAGNYANAFGAASCTGTGEEILEASAASAIVTRLEDGMSLDEAGTRLMERHSRKDFGFIALDSLGNALAHATQGSLAFVLVTTSGVFPGLLQRDWLAIK